MDFLSGNVGVQGQHQPGQVVQSQQQQQPQVGGVMPVVGVDSEGYWTLNGERAMLQSQLNAKFGQHTSEVRDLRTQLEQSQQAASSYLAELTTMRQREVARAEGVSEGAMSFALWGANQAATSGKDFTTALKEFMQANPAVFGAPQGAGQQVQQPATAVQQTPTQPGFVLPAANPGAQPVQTQQPIQPSAQVTQTTPVGLVQPQTAQVQTQGMQLAAAPGQMQASQPVGFVSSGVAGFTGSMPVGSAAIDADADRFLASKGIKLPEGV